MIIFGTRGVTLSGESGFFHCPSCGGSEQAYRRKSVRRFFTLYFIPLIPMDKLGEYIECQNCKGSFKNEVLEYDPGQVQQEAQTEFLDHLKRMMVLAALVDGHVPDDEIEAIQEFYQDTAGTTLSREQIQSELEMARRANAKPLAYCRTFAGSLTEHGKEKILRGVLHVIYADGLLSEEEEVLPNQIAEAMGMSPAHLKGIMSEFHE